MPNSTQSSPAPPGSARRQKSRRSRSVGSPAMSNASARLSAIVQEHREKNLGSFALSPLVRRSLLTDNTDIGEPTRKSWWKNLDENSRDVIEVLESNKIVEPNNIMEELDLEILSQEKKTYTLDIPDSSDGESIHSIVLPQRKLFTDKTHQTQNKFGKLIDNRDTLDRLHKANATNTDKAMNVGPKELFQNKRSKPIFPAALLNISPNKTMADKTLTAVEPQPQVRNIFGNRQGTKRKNMFANFILSESEDEISEIQAKVFEFHKESTAKTPNIRDHSPTSSVTTDMELDEWQHLPSSTMVENQLEAMIPSGQTPKRARLSILSEAKESECGGTINKTKQSNKSSSVKNLSKIIVNEKSPESNKSLTIRNRSRAENDQVNKSTEKQNKSITKSSTKNISKSSTLTMNKSLSNNSDNMEKNISQTQKNNKQANMSVNKSTTQDHNRDLTDKGQEVNPENVKDDTDDELNLTLEYENEDNDGVGDKCDQRQMTIINKSNNNTNKSKTKETSEQNIGKITNNNKSNENVEESDAFKLSMKNNERNDKHKENESKISSGDIETTTVNNLKTQEVNEIEGNKTADINRNDVSANNTSTGNNQNIFQNTGKECEDNENQNEELNNKDDNSMIHENENNEAEQEEQNLSIQSQLDENQELNKTEEIEDDKQNGSQQTHNESGVENSENRNESEGNDTENEIKDANQSEDIQNESQEEVQNATEVEEDDNESDNEMEEGNQSLQNEIQEAQNVTNEEENLEESENEIEAPNETQEIQNESENEEKYISEEEIENDEVENELEESDQEAENDEEVESNQEQNSDQSNNQIESDQDNDQQEESDQDNDQQEESDQEIESNHSIQDNQEENQDTDEINATPNVSHDTTGRNRKKNQSPEMVLHDTTNNQMADMATFIQRRNTNARTTKSMIKNLHTPILAPARDSVGFSDGSKNSTAEGSGWDSHRTTRKTLRQTFGKDFTPRKSLRTLVMEKSAKRQTYHPNQSDSSVTSKFPLANSTTLPEVIEYDECANAVESNHEVSIRTRQTNLEMYLQKVKKQNMEKQLKMEEAVKQYLKAPPRNMDSLFKVPTKPIPRRPIAKSTKTKPKQTKSLGCLQYLPEDVIEDMKYKPPKRFQPSDAPWITKRLYKYLETKLEAKYHYKARVRSEKLVESIYHFTKDLRRQETASIDAVKVLKCEMARLDIVRTHHEFYLFFHQFMPREVRIKVVPDVINKIPLPRHGVFADILRGI